MQCTPSKMANMGVTMDHLLAKVMTAEIMAAFAFSLSDWLELAFSDAHACNLSNDD